MPHSASGSIVSGVARCAAHATPPETTPAIAKGIFCAHARRSSGYQSRATSVTKNVMPHALPRSDRIRHPHDAAYQPRERSGVRPVSALLRYATSDSSQKTPLIVSRRSAIHATDSTRSGWIDQKSAAAAAASRRWTSGAARVAATRSSSSSRSA